MFANVIAELSPKVLGDNHVCALCADIVPADAMFSFEVSCLPIIYLTENSLHSSVLALSTPASRIPLIYDFKAFLAR